MEVGARIEETSPKMFNRSQRAGFVPEGWIEVYKLQFLFCFFFFSSSKKRRSRGPGKCRCVRGT